jgi:hypothetical protein
MTRCFVCASPKLLLLVGVLVATALAALGLGPEPDPVPRRWQLDVEVGPLRVASVQIEGEQRSFYYLTYKVTNATGQDLLFAPAFELVTEDGIAQRSGRDVPAAATTQLLTLLNNPFLQDQISVVGILLQGPENAREGLAVWPVSDTTVDELTIFGSGFSGETRAIEVRNPSSGKLERVLLRKTLMVRYLTPGEIAPAADALPVAERRWILR